MNWSMQDAAEHLEEAIQAVLDERLQVATEGGEDAACLLSTDDCRGLPARQQSTPDFDTDQPR